MENSNDVQNTANVGNEVLADVMPSVCLHLITYVDEDNFQRCQSCDEIVD